MTTDRQTDRQTDHATPCVVKPLSLDVMRPKNLSQLAAIRTINLA